MLSLVSSLANRSRSRGPVTATLVRQPFRPFPHRRNTRFALIYQRALRNLFLLRTAGTKEPSPISGHFAVGGHPHREIPNEPTKLLKTMDRTNESNPFSEESAPRTCITKATGPPGLPRPRRQKAPPQLPSSRGPFLRCICSLSGYTVVSELGYGEPPACPTLHREDFRTGGTAGSAGRAIFSRLPGRDAHARMRF